MVEKASRKAVILLPFILLIAALLSMCSDEASDRIQPLDYGKNSSYLIQISPELRQRYGFPAKVDEIDRFADRIQKSVKPDNQRVRDLVRGIAGRASPEIGNISDAVIIYRYIQSKWVYSAGSENFESTPEVSDVINDNFRGSTYEYSVLMSSILESLGFRTRIVLGCNLEREICIAFPEVLIGAGDKGRKVLEELSGELESSVYCSYDPKTDQYWLSLDLLSGRVGGKLPVDRIYLIVYPEDGKWEVVSK